jgi:hypothetical protein
MVADDQNRIAVIPWTPPSLYRRREIIQGEGDRSSAMRPMEAKARGLLIDAVRGGYRLLDELTSNPDQTIGRLRRGKVRPNVGYARFP